MGPSQKSADRCANRNTPLLQERRLQVNNNGDKCVGRKCKHVDINDLNTRLGRTVIVGTANGSTVVLMRHENH